MRQLPLPVQLRASSLFETFHSGVNAPAVEQLTAVEARRVSLLTWLYGPSGVGKTHLLQAVCARAGSRSLTAAYFPLRDRELNPDMLLGCEVLNFVCLDDFESIAGHAEWERAVFRLHNELDETGGRLFDCSWQPGDENARCLEDLASRLTVGVAYRLEPLSDDEQVLALSLRAKQLGLELPMDVTQFLLRRLPRDMTTLCDALDKLDRASLATQRKLTVPFVRTFLDEPKTP